MSKYLTTAEMAEEMGCSQEMICKYIKRGLSSGDKLKAKKAFGYWTVEASEWNRFKAILLTMPRNRRKVG